MDSIAHKITLAEWKKKLKQLEEVDLPKARARLVDAAPAGDWDGNAEFEDAERQVEILMARINDIRQMIVKLNGGKQKITSTKLKITNKS